MDPAVIQDLRLGHAHLQVEQATASPLTRRAKAEAFHALLWGHRDDLVQLVLEREAVAASMRDLVAGLAPFGRCAQLLPPGQNPVLISLPAPTDGGRTFVQLRPADFRRAAALLKGHAS